MTAIHDTFSGSDGRSMPYTLWTPDAPPRAVLSVLHGMTEHRGRYTVLAEASAAAGIACAAFDLRGHGEHDGDPLCASLGEDGWQRSLADADCFAKHLRTLYPQIPHFCLGFSLGSFLLREILSVTQTPFAGAIIVGTGHQPPAVLSVICKIVSSQVRKFGRDVSTPLVQKLSFDTYNARFKPNRTSSDWLCADETMLDAYLADPLCRRHISAGLFYELLSAMKRTGSKKFVSLRDPSTPILLLSGTCDPVGDFGRGVRYVEASLRSAGCTDLSCTLYPDARHDLLHEEASGAAAHARTAIVEWITAHL
ncbi:MAG: alpha/beta fold hydrolase [Clostridia bacterium]|nr:alpha/beta fold hydrolase [Clostridia bacterium]